MAEQLGQKLTIDVQAFGPVRGGDLVVFVDDELKVTDRVAARLESAAGLIARAAVGERFKGKPNTALVIPAPAGLEADRLVAVGIGGAADRDKLNWVNLGGFVAGKVLGRAATVWADLPGVTATAEGVADLTLGARLRAYAFDRYKTRKKKDNGELDTPTAITVMTAESGARRAAKAREGLAEGVALARDLVNEPPNVLGPEEFAERTRALSKAGVDVEVLDEAALTALGMRALLAVGQGSARESRVVILRWMG